ncbi:MAG: AAA family ATPase, partial [Methanobacterium sp.]
MINSFKLREHYKFTFMINNYIEPILRIYDSLNGITDDKEEFSNFSGIINNVVTSNDLLKGGNFFILGEPGVGKSSLLREIVSKAKIQHYFTLKINLPDFNIETLETEVIQFYSENSKLNLNFDFSNYLICLDALDEVNPD